MKKVYLGKFFIISFVSILVLILIGSILGEILSDTSFSVGRLVALFFGISAFPLLVMIAITYFFRDTVLGLFIADEKGMYFTCMKTKKRSIDWNTINRVRLMPAQMQFNKELKREIKYPSYIVFSSNEIFDEVSSNIQSNFCIFKPNKKIYTLISPYFAKISNLEQYQEEIKRFFEESAKP